MDFFNSPENPEKIEVKNQDLISNLPTLVTDKILKCLPLTMAAQMSVLSRKWRHNWLCIRHVVIDRAFWIQHRSNEKYDWQKISNIISNILLHHNGPIHKFLLFIPKHQGTNLNISQWVSFLSKIGVKKISFVSWCDRKPLPSHIFSTKELVKLTVNNFALIHPPNDFKGFAHLRTLELLCMEFKHEDVFKNLVASCPRLTELSLQYWTGMKNIVIDVPSLENLVIHGVFESLSFKNVHRLRIATLNFDEKDHNTLLNPETIDAINNLAGSCELQYLLIGGKLCKFLASGFTTRLHAVPFNFLQKLSLSGVDLGESDIFCFTFGILQKSPFITALKLALTPNKSVVLHKFDYPENFKLEHLRKVKITGITGSRSELKLIEFLFDVAVVLENLFFKCEYLDLSSELKVSRELMRLPRSSPKAKLICLEQYRI